LAALAAPLVEAEIGRDAIDPASQRGATLEAGALVDDLYEDVLDDLLGVRRAARDTVREPINACGVAAHQRLEGFAIARCRTREQDAFVGAHARESTPRRICAARHRVQTNRGGVAMAEDFEYVSKTGLMDHNDPRHA